MNGAVPIPKSKINQVKKLGFKICRCCKQRIVPLEPVNYTTLSILCIKCWKNKSTIQEHTVDNKISKSIYK